MNRNAIAIVGMQCVLPGAASLAQYWNNLRDGVSAIRTIPPGRLNDWNSLPESHRSLLSCTRGGFLVKPIHFDPLNFGIMPKIVRNGDPDQFLMLSVIAGALADAGVANDDPIRRATDVIIGRGGYLTNKMSEIYIRSELLGRMANWLEDHMPHCNRGQREQLVAELAQALPADDVDSLSTCMPNLVASRAANRLNLHGTAYTVDAACASSLVAVEHAVERLRDGRCDLAVASGVHLCHVPTFWFVFAQLDVISPSSQIRPFDRRADGLLIGEGAGAVVLKRLEDACRDKDRVYAVIRGVGMASDGSETAILTPSTEGQVLAVRRAYEDAGVDPDTIGYLEAHGTGTTVGDRVEAETIKTVFGVRDDRFPPRKALGSVKSMLGHTMPAAGIASLIKVSLSLCNKTLLPSLNCTEPLETIHQTDFYVNPETRPWIHSTAHGPRRAAINAFGFGGINVHAVLEEVTEQSIGNGRPLRRRPLDLRRGYPSELILVSATSPTELVGKLERIAGFLERSGPAAVLKDVACAALAEVDFDHSHKLALVCDDLAHLQRRIGTARDALRGAPTDLDAVDEVYYQPNADRPSGRIAGIFPGVGFPGLIGNYPGHLMELCRWFPEVRAQFDKIELRDGHDEDPIPTSSILSPPTTIPERTRLRLRNRVAAMKVIDDVAKEEIEVRPWERNIAASGVTVSNWVSWLLLKNLQVPVEMLCGQSQGEMAALCAAGIFDIDEIMPRFWEALAVSPSYAGDGRLAFVGASEARIADDLAAVPDTSVAIHVAPEMLIIGGKDSHLAELTAKLQKEGIMVQQLPYPPIHTPRLSHMRDELLQVMDTNIRFGKPEIKVYSAVTEQPFPEDAQEIRDTALMNLDRPVRFWQTIHRMYDEGARIFIQIGGGTMAANIRTILPKPDVVGTAVDLDYRHPITQLHHLCATLFTNGIRFDPAYLFAHRQARPVALDEAAPQRRDQPPTAVPLRMDWVPFSRSVPTEGPAAVATQSTTNGAAQTGRLAAETLPASNAAPAADSGGQQPGGAEQQRFEALCAALPLVGEVTHLVAGQEIVTQRQFDLDEDLFLHDHAFVGPTYFKPLEDRLPLLPLTMILELLAESSCLLAPDLGLIGFERVRALSWMALRSTRAMQVSVTAAIESVDPQTGVHRIRAEAFADGKSSATATVLLGDAYREDVQLRFRAPGNPRAWPLTPADMYVQRHMFHGPRFQCVTGFDVLADSSASGELTVLSKEGLFASNPEPYLLLDPVILDGVAQVFGMWSSLNDLHILPAAIDKVEFYAPSPPPGTRAPMRLEIRELDRARRNVRADAEVLDGQGNVWFRMTGINEWVFDYSRRLVDSQRLPAQHHVTTEIGLPHAPAETVGVFLSRSVLKHASIEWLSALFLHREEMAEFDRPALLSRRWQWLLGRIAAKDAVRIYLARKMGTEMLAPADIVILSDANGRPYAAAFDGWPPMPQISIAHSEGRAVAVAAEVNCGIDLEPVSRDTETILDQFASAEEIALLASVASTEPGRRWPTRLWCAKEALAKALGTGLSGRPSQFQVVDIDAEGCMLVHHRPTQDAYVAYTYQSDSMIVAHTLLSYDAGDATRQAPTNGSH